MNYYCNSLMGSSFQLHKQNPVLKTEPSHAVRETALSLKSVSLREGSEVRGFSKVFGGQGARVWGVLIGWVRDKIIGSQSCPLGPSCFWMGP